MEELGMLQPVDPKSLWGHEAHEFTPWLLENAEGLADALGIDLELETSEHRVGAFSLDLIGKDQTNGTILMIENQLASTDHSQVAQTERRRFVHRRWREVLDAAAPMPHWLERYARIRGLQAL